MICLILERDDLKRVVVSSRAGEGYTYIVGVFEWGHKGDTDGGVISIGL